MGLVLLDITGLGEPRCIEDANLGKRLHLLRRFKDAISYHYAVPALEFVKVCAIDPTLIARITLLVRVVENVKVVVVNIFAAKDIGDELHNGGLADTRPSHQEDGVWLFHLVL